MEKAITTILLTVASIVAMLMVINATFPTVSRTSGAITQAGTVLTDRMKTEVEIIHAGGEVGSSTAYVWVKNVGSSRIGALNQADLFVGIDGTFTRYTAGDGLCLAPCWENTVENAVEWEPSSTLRITIYLASPLAAGSTYYVKLVTNNGASDARYFTL